MLSSKANPFISDSKDNSYIREVVRICLEGHVTLVAAIFFAVTVFNLLDLIIPKALQLLVASLEGDRLAIFGFSLEGLITPGNRIFFFSFIIPFMALLKWVFGYVKGVLQARLGQGALFVLRNKIYEHVQALSFSYHDQAHSGRFIANIIEDVNAVSDFFARPFFLAFMSVTGFICIYIYIFSLSWLAGAVSLLIILLSTSSLLLFIRYGYPIYLKARKSLEVMVGIFSENMEGHLLIRSFGRQKEERDKFVVAAKSYHDAMVQSRILWSLLNQSFLWGVMLGVPAVLAVGIHLYRNQPGFGSDSIMALFVLQNALMLRMRVLSRIIDGWSKFTVSANRLGGLFNTRLFLPDVGNVKSLVDVKSISESSASCCLEVPAGAMTVTGVSFSYTGSSPALSDISLTIGEGETVALVGETGSGKSTLALLLCRFYDPGQGLITIGGVDIRNIPLSKLRREFALVFQDTFLFSATVRENIAYGNSGANNDDVVAAAVLAKAHDFILKLPDGYDTVIGERGMTLSGGQRQRLAIARAVLRHPRFLILDDATSSLDIQTEYEIQQSLDNLPHDITKIIIAHRYSSIENADKVFVLSDGKIVEAGSAAELRRKDSIMNRILLLEKEQSDGEE